MGVNKQVLSFAANELTSQYLCSAWMLTPTPKLADNVEWITGPKIFIRSNNISKETVACLQIWGKVMAFCETRLLLNQLFFPP